jgi:hypothetical protein
MKLIYTFNNIVSAISAFFFVNCGSINIFSSLVCDGHLRIMRGVSHSLHENVNTCTEILVGESEKKSIEGSRHILEYDIEMILNSIM